MADFSCALVENVCGYVLIACVKTVATFSPFGRVLPAAVLPRLACSAGTPSAAVTRPEGNCGIITLWPISENSKQLPVLLACRFAIRKGIV